MNKETVIEVVEKLVGDIQPYGATHIDEKRFENLKLMCELTEYFVSEIGRVADNKKRQEYSMKKMGEYATNFLNELLNVDE